MNFSEFNRTARTCVLMCLIIALWTIIANGAIYTFLHPRSLPLLKTSFVILCGFTLYSFRKVASAGSGRILNWKACILFLPVAFGAYVKPTGLSSRIAVQKGLASVAMTPQHTTDTSDNAQFPIDSAVKDDFRKGDTMAIAIPTGSIALLPARTRNACDTMQDDSLYVKLDQIYSNPRRSEGKKVAMTGFVAPDTLLGRHSFFIARMLVACCAADAMPVGFYCVSDSVLGIHEGDWVMLSGQIETRAVKLPWDKEKRLLPILRVLSTTETVAPRRQYIYPVAY